MKSKRTAMRSKKSGSPSVMGGGGGGGERSMKSSPNTGERSRKTSPTDRSQKLKKAPNRTVLVTPPSLNLVSVQKVKTMMDRSKKPAADRSRKYQQQLQPKAVSVLKIPPSLNLVSVQGAKGDRYTVMKTRMQSVAKKQSVFPSATKKKSDYGPGGGSIAVGTSLMTEAVQAAPTVFPKRTGLIKVLDTESVTSTTDRSRVKTSPSQQSRRKLGKGEQTTFDFLTPKGTRSTRYAASTRRPDGKRGHVVPCVYLIILLSMLVGALVVWMLGATSEQKSTTIASTEYIRLTTTDLPPIEIALPIELETTTTTTVSTTTVTYTTAVKRPPLNMAALKEACGSPCWYHPEKFATSCQSIECHSVELFVGQGVRGQANYSFYMIKQSSPLTRRSTTVSEGTPCKTPDRSKVGVCSGRQCVDITDQSDYVKFDQHESGRADGQWTAFGRFRNDQGSCLVSHDYYNVASQLLKPKYIDLCKTLTRKVCYAFMVGFRSCTQKYPASGGKHCFEIDQSTGWLKLYDQSWPVVIRGCGDICKDKSKMPPARPLDFKPDCRHRFADEYSCPLANGDFSTADDDMLAVTDFDYCCNGNEIGRCLLGTCTPVV